MSLVELYDTLTDVQKLVLCTRDFCVADVCKVAYRLGVEIGELGETFSNMYEDLSEEVDYHIDDFNDDEIERSTEEVINKCADWLNKMCSASNAEISEYLNSKGD